MGAVALAAILGGRPISNGALAVRAPTDPDVLEFVASAANAGPFHHPSWMQALSDAYGYPGHVLTLEDGRIRAALPAMHVRSWLTGERLVALPFTDHCPPLLGSEAVPLAAELARLGERVAVAVHAQLPAADGLSHSDAGWRHVLDLRAGLEAIEARIRPTPVGRALRRARRSGLEIEVSTSPDAIADYYRLHCRTRRRLGVPPQPRRFFQALQTLVLAPGLGFVVLARHGREAVAGAVFLEWNRRVVYKYAASDPAWWPARPNQLVLWAAIERACAGGSVELDLGRTDAEHGGLREFKRRWGARELPLVYSSAGTRRPAAAAAPGAASGLIRVLSVPLGRAVGEVMYRHIA